MEWLAQMTNLVEFWVPDNVSVDGVETLAYFDNPLANYFSPLCGNEEWDVTQNVGHLHCVCTGVEILQTRKA